MIKFDISKKCLGNLEGQIEDENISLIGARNHEPKIYFRAETQNYFVRFLVQVKTVEFDFEIN